MISVTSPDGPGGYDEFLRLHDRAYEYRSAAYEEFAPLTLPILQGDSPFLRDRKVRPFVASDQGEPVARVLAVLDGRYHARWKERLGHLVFFEALPRSEAAVRSLMDDACDWLRSQGASAARAGFGMLDMPFSIDEYERLPPLGVRQNPPWYHSLLQSSRFGIEKGWVDYRISVTPELTERYEAHVQRAEASGYDLVPLGEIPRGERGVAFFEPYNRFFRDHWGYSPFVTEDMSLLVQMQEALDTEALSVVARRSGETVGAVWVAAPSAIFARVRPERVLAPEERVNFLGIGVAVEHRGRGVNLAIASSAYLKLIRRGASHLSYTMVVDDNWSSRRTAEKLGASVCATYVVYRRELGSGGRGTSRARG